MALEDAYNMWRYGSVGTFNEVTGEREFVAACFRNPEPRTDPNRTPPICGLCGISMTDTVHSYTCDECSGKARP